MNHKEYNNYFKTIAEKHQDIQHSENEKHFARVLYSAEPFRKIDLNEYLQSEGSKMKYPCLIVESFEAKYMDRGSNNHLKILSGSFYIVDRVNRKDDYEEEETVIDFTEDIIEDVIAYMRADFRSTQRKSSGAFKLDAIETEKVKLDSKTVGVRADFVMLFSRNQKFHSTNKFLS